MHACRRADVEVWSYGGALSACRRGNMEIWSSGALDERYWRRATMETERWRCVAGVQTWKYEDMELSRSEGGLRV